jgi:uracil-DNA glycosylase
MRRLFDVVAPAPLGRLIPASNVVFNRSRRANDLRNFHELANKCWPFHQFVIDRLRPKVIVCLGMKAGNYVRYKLEASKEPLKECEEKNNRKWKSRWYRTGGRPDIIVLSHPSVADWCNPRTDPTGLVRDALDRSRQH